MKYKGLDVPTLEFVQTMFSYYSDMSTKCQGYKHLCNMIKDSKNFITNEPKVVRNNEQKKKFYNGANCSYTKGKCAMEDRSNCEDHCPRFIK